MIRSSSSVSVLVTTYFAIKRIAYFAIIPSTSATKTITIGDRKGSFTGMLHKRTFRVNFLAPHEAKRFDLDLKSDKEVVYEGKRVIIKL